jgi:protein phosphatase
MATEPAGHPAKAAAEAAGATHQGRKRDHNEDVFLLRPDLGLFVVCDGMGGHRAGEIAADIATSTIADFFEACQRDPEGTWPSEAGAGHEETGSMLALAMKLANRRLRAAAEEDPARRGMGTTCVAVHLTPQETYVAWAGDSRAYLWRNQMLTPVTEDHSLVGEMLRRGELTDGEAQRHPHKNVITRCLGPMEFVAPETRRASLQVGDVLMLCSDGLHGMVRDGEMAAILRAQPELKAACRELIDAANANGGADNITVVLVRRVE